MTDNRTTEQRISKPLLGFIKHQRNRGYIDAGQAQWLFNIADEIEAKYEQAIAATLGSGTLTAEQVRKCVRVGACDHGLWGALDEDTDWQAIADELNAELGSDDGYESKMDALLSRLTGGKWSKSRAYGLDFMESCVREEFETDELERESDCIAEQRERIEKLESLARSLFNTMSTLRINGCAPTGRQLDHFDGRMRALGLDGDE